MVYYNAATVVTHCLGLSRGDTMLSTRDLLEMDNEQLYSLYLEALKDRDLPMLNTVRSVVADKYSLKALRQSPLDEPFKNHDIARFFSLK